MILKKLLSQSLSFKVRPVNSDGNNTDLFREYFSPEHCFINVSSPCPQGAPKEQTSSKVLLFLTVEYFEKIQVLLDSVFCPFGAFVREFEHKRGKLTEANVAKYLKNYNIIASTETWLKPQIFVNEILCSEFQIFGCDRSNIIEGGVLFAAHSSFPSEEVLVPKTDSFEFKGIKIYIKSYYIYLTLSYVTP